MSCFRPMFAAVLLAFLASLQSASAATVLVGVFQGNDSDADQLERLAGLTTEISALDRVNWDSEGSPSQISGDLTVTGTTFKNENEATAGTWEYTGEGTIDYITVKFGRWVALYEITDGDTSGFWDLALLCNADPAYCAGSKRNPQPFAMSHVSAYRVVPIPATAWLFGSGLIALAGIARRRNQA